MYGTCTYVCYMYIITVCVYMYNTGYLHISHENTVRDLHVHMHVRDHENTGSTVQIHM